MNRIIIILLTFGLSQQGCSQTTNSRNNKKIVGGGCEGCEAVNEYGNKILEPVDTLPDYWEAGPKLEVSGTIYRPDGKTPARDVILYIYHTNQKGEYSKKGDETGWGKRHGYIRGWIKTGADGKYKFFTLKPAAYPGRDIPAHIHPVIKEPGLNEYWIDEYLFDDDPLLTTDERKQQQKRGGNGVLKTKQRQDGTLVATRDITLGLNIPNYQ
jgi:protocatechuate 3,4-dioxygenase beta subunit